jgi:hypothetical protein
MGISSAVETTALPAAWRAALVITRSVVRIGIPFPESFQMTLGSLNTPHDEAGRARVSRQPAHHPVDLRMSGGVGAWSAPAGDVLGSLLGVVDLDVVAGNPLVVVDDELKE